MVEASVSPETTSVEIPTVSAVPVAPIAEMDITNKVTEHSTATAEEFGVVNQSVEMASSSVEPTQIVDVQAEAYEALRKRADAIYYPSLNAVLVNNTLYLLAEG